MSHTHTHTIVKYLVRDNKIILFLLICLSFVNVFMAEWFQFTEALLMYAVSISAAVAAVCTFPTKTVVGKQNRAYIISFLCLWTSYHTYQIGSVFFVFHVLGLLYLENGGRLDLPQIKKVIYAAISMFLTVLSSLVIHNLMMKHSYFEEQLIFDEDKCYICLF